MQRSLDLLRDYWIHARDGQIGAVKDFLFDDQSWQVRFMVVDTGNWLPGRRVLISPVSISRADWVERQIEVNLSKQQVKDSPDVDTRRPVSRQMEERIYQHYAWPLYRTAHGGTPIGELLPAAATHEPGAPRDDPHLRSVKETTRYSIHASDGPLGELHDFLCDDADWTIRYLVVDMGKWISGKQVLIAPTWVQAIHWDKSEVRLALPRVAIRNSPEYQSGDLNRSYEEQLHEYYGRQMSWA